MSIIVDEYRVLDLFSGIGGFSLGLERAGMKTIAFCEQDGYACRVLRKHWPMIPIFEDIKTLTHKKLKSHGLLPNILCGGFPCQDISTAGKGAGLAGERSGLWREYARLIREVKPRYAIMENVAALRSRGLDQVLGDLAAIGYDAEWHCIPAAALGAPHQRDRVWIVAYPKSGQVRRLPRRPKTEIALLRFCCVHENVPHADGERCENRRDGQDSSCKPCREAQSREFQAWPVEPDIPRVAHGVSHRVDRLRCLGNAVVPQIPEMIGRAIIASQTDL